MQQRRLVLRLLLTSIGWRSIDIDRQPFGDAVDGVSSVTPSHYLYFRICIPATWWCVCSHHQAAGACYLHIAISLLVMPHAYQQAVAAFYSYRPLWRECLLSLAPKRPNTRERLYILPRVELIEVQYFKN